MRKEGLTLDPGRGQFMPRIDRIRQPRKGQGTGKGRKRVRWEISVGFGTSDLKETAEHCLLQRKRLILSPGVWGTWGHMSD